jgi:hypothetical protein
LAGGYRKIIEIPSQFEWSIAHYDDFQQQLVPTDLTILQNKEITVPKGKYLKNFFCSD